MMSKVISGSRQGCSTNQEMMAFWFGYFYFEKDVKEWFPSIRTLVEQKMKFLLPEHSVQNVRSFEEFLLLDATYYENITFISRKFLRVVQDVNMYTNDRLVDRTAPKMSTQAWSRVENSSQRLVQSSEFKCIKEDGGVLETSRIRSLDEKTTFLAGRGRRKDG